MNSILKNQILKPLSKFTKNLSPDRIQISAIKGEGELNNLEFDEAALMELLDLPTWLTIKKAVCNHVHVKIQWTKLKSHPITVHLDNVLVEIEALEEPRPLSSSNVPSYRVDQGEYGFIDRVIDGIRVSISNVRIVFTAAAFKASLELTRVLVSSKMPNWKDAELRSTAVRDPSRNAILLFKEILWDTTRIEANGLQDLQVTPVKLITNTARIRITIKKRLSDCVILSSRVQFLLDDLLWVLTISQMEAAIIFMKSLKKSILKSSQQSKAHAEEKIQRQTGRSTSSSGSLQTQDSLSPRNGMTMPAPHASTSSSSSQGAGSRRASGATPVATNHSSQASARAAQLSRLFEYYDVGETSYHLHTGRVELHLCEEGQPGVKLSSNAVCNGALRCTLLKMNLDFYPFHVHGADKHHWPGYLDLCKVRTRWVNGLLQEFHEKHTLSDKQTGEPPPHRLMESATVLRLEDFHISTVTTTRKQRGIAATKPPIFFGSDKARLKLPEETTSVFVDYTEYYDPEALANTGDVIQRLPVPEPKLFVQLNPVHLQIDYETIVWLNAFYLNLTKNLSAWSELVPVEQSSVFMDSIKMHVRMEALMPRLVFTAEYDVSGQPERPTGLQVLASTLSIHNVLSTDGERHWSALHDLVSSFMGRSTDGSHSGAHWARAFHNTKSSSTSTDQFLRKPHDATVDWRVFQKPSSHLSSDAAQLELMWRVQSDQVWMEFTGMRNNSLRSAPTGHRNNTQQNRPQTFLEPIPFTLWTHVSVALDNPTPSTPQGERAVAGYPNGSCGLQQMTVDPLLTSELYFTLERLQEEKLTKPRAAVTLNCLCDFRGDSSVPGKDVSSGAGLVQLRLSHYQLLFINRLTDSLTRIADSLTADQTEILVTRSATPLHMEAQEALASAMKDEPSPLELSVACRLPAVHVVLLMPALAEGLPMPSSSSMMLNKHEDSDWSLAEHEGGGGGGGGKVTMFTNVPAGMRTSCSSASLRRGSNDVMLQSPHDNHTTGASGILMDSSNTPEGRPRSSLGFLANGPVSGDSAIPDELSDVTGSLVNPRFRPPLDSTGSSLSTNTSTTRQVHSVGGSPILNPAPRPLTTAHTTNNTSVNVAGKQRVMLHGGEPSKSASGSRSGSTSMFSAFSRIGEKLKTTAAQAVGSVAGVSTLEDDMDSDRGSIAGSDFSDGNDEILLALQVSTGGGMDNEPYLSGDASGPEYSFLGPSVHDIQMGRTIASEMIPVEEACDVVNSPMLVTGDEAMSVMSSCTSRGGGTGHDVVSTVTFCLTHIECALSVNPEGFALSVVGGNVCILESGANKNGLPTGSNEHLDADGGSYVRCPVHDLTPTNTASTFGGPAWTDSALGSESESLPVVALRISPKLSQDLTEKGGKPMTGLHMEARLLRSLELQLLMSSVTNLADFSEDELVQDASQFPTLEVYLEATLDLRLREDRPCSNLTCPGQHPVTALRIPPGLRISRDRDLVLSLQGAGVVPVPAPVPCQVATMDRAIQALLLLPTPPPPERWSQHSQTPTPPLLFSQASQTMEIPAPPPAPKAPPARPPPITRSATVTMTQGSNTDLSMGCLAKLIAERDEARLRRSQLTDATTNTINSETRPVDIPLTSTSQQTRTRRKSATETVTDVALQTSPVATQMPGGLSMSLPLSIMTSPQLASPALSFGHQPSQELLNHYYQENVRLRQKVTCLRKEKMQCLTDFSQCQRELEETRRERDVFLATLEKLQNELAQRSSSAAAAAATSGSGVGGGFMVSHPSSSVPIGGNPRGATGTLYSASPPSRLSRPGLPGGNSDSLNAPPSNSSHRFSST